MNTHNVGVIKPKDGFGLLNKLLLETLHNLAVASSGDSHVASGIVTLTIFLEEKLLNRHFTLEQSVLRQVGDAEAALPQLLNYSIFSTLKRGIRL